LKKLGVCIYFLSAKAITIEQHHPAKPKIKYRGEFMKFTDKEHNYIETDEEREAGHVDTRHQNFDCENKDPALGCNLGIDVAG
jgi:hypothetical protein